MASLEGEGEPGSSSVAIIFTECRTGMGPGDHHTQLQRRKPGNREVVICLSSYTISEELELDPELLPTWGSLQEGLAKEINGVMKCPLLPNLVASIY